ncbi:MAG: hypothetical protein V4538_03125 [Bacteroidota bacterium]
MKIRKRGLFVFSLFILLNISSIGQNKFLIKWEKEKLNKRERIIMLNDYISDFALFMNSDSKRIDSNCIRSSNKTYFDNYEKDKVLFYFIKLYLGNDTKFKENNLCYYSFIMNIIKLSSFDQQRQFFQNYIIRTYLEERSKFRKVLGENEIEKLTQIVSLFPYKKDLIYYQKQIKLLYKMEVKMEEEANQKIVDCFCK